MRDVSGLSKRKFVNAGIVSYFEANKTNKSRLFHVQKWDSPVARMSTEEKQLCSRDELWPRVQLSRCCFENPKKNIPNTTTPRDVRMGNVLESECDLRMQSIIVVTNAGGQLQL